MDLALNHTEPDANIIRVKADLLCLGLRPTEAALTAYGEQNPESNWKTGNVGLHLTLPGNTCVLVTLTHPFDEHSPYSLVQHKNCLFLSRGNRLVCDVSVIPTPRWYGARTSTGLHMGSVFLHEGSHFLHQAYSGCDYYGSQRQCRYCATSSEWLIGTPYDVLETVRAAYTEDPAYHVCLGGGTRLPHRRNTAYFVGCAEKIRQEMPEVPIWVEMIPPETREELDDLISSGVTSFGFNIEIWSDDVRRVVCPGKSEVPKGRYLARMQEAVALLGSNRVGSCLLVGLEPLESTAEGVAQLTGMGVQPCLLPFKPWANSTYSDHPLCNPESLLAASSRAVHMMERNGINPDQNQGCLLCEGCTVDHDILHALQWQTEGAKSI